MNNIVVAAILAAASICSPAVLVVASPAMAVDCTDPGSPGNRPGGYCKLIAPGGTLASPVDPGAGPVLCQTFGSNASDYIPRDYGERVYVAGIVEECDPKPEPCAAG